MRSDPEKKKRFSGPFGKNGKTREPEEERRKPVRVKVVRLGDDEDTSREEEIPQREPGGRRSSRGRNTELAILTWVFSAMFVLLAGYMVWFNASPNREKLLNNPYNSKQDTASDRIIRGSIVTEQGAVLASTQIDYSGNEVRTYPYANLFAHTIGYASNGKAGLEASSGNVLMSSHSSLLGQLKDAKNNQKVRGDTLVVTLDPSLQQAAYYALGGFNGAVVVLEPDSGKILAMVSKPDFDPNSIAYVWDELMNDSSSSVLLNRACQGLYPPGSTFKILTALAYLRQRNGVYDDFLYDCTGVLTRGDVTITCYNNTVHGTETLKNAFANSCNTAFAQIGLDLDHDRFRRMCDQFLFNKSLPADFPCSRSTFMLQSNSVEEDKMTTSIGQGDTLITPLHLSLITSAVANSGVLMKPFLVSRIETSEGELVSQTDPEICAELMTVDEAEIIGSFMRATVTEGTAQALSWNSYSVAGKTGSAEYETGGITGTHSWFTGYSNVDDPDIVVTVIAEDGGTGSATAVPIAQQIFDAYYAGR